MASLGAGYLAYNPDHPRGIFLTETEAGLEAAMRVAEGAYLLGEPEPGFLHLRDDDGDHYFLRIELGIEHD